jgi:hypothetical protein
MDGTTYLLRSKRSFHGGVWPSKSDYTYGIRVDIYLPPVILIEYLKLITATNITVVIIGV